MHLKRWLTALILLPFLLLVLFKGGYLGFVLLIMVISALGQWEFLGLFQPEAHGAQRFKSIILGTMLLISFTTAQRAPTLCNPSAPLFILVLVLFILLLFYLLSYGHVPDLGRDLMVNTLGLLYLPLLMGHFIWLRYLPQGELWVLWLLAVMFTGDTLAFYTGQLVGGPKLYPAVSPGKTWSGTMGGVAASLAVGVLLGLYLFPKVSLLGLIWLSLILGVVGLLGDLFESMIKRQAHVKDASQLLPGHGGMLDRLDSLLFAAPAVVYARLFILG
jgi:phosphatidate cytidylyltransferase